MSDQQPLFTVDTVELRHLASRMRTLQDDLKTRHGLLPDAEQYGERDLISAAHRFASTWGSAVRILEHDLDAAAGKLTGCARDYDETDGNAKWLFDACAEPLQ